MRLTFITSALTALVLSWSVSAHADPSISSFTASTAGKISGKIALGTSCSGGTFTMRANISVDADAHDGNPGTSKGSFFLTDNIRLGKQTTLSFKSLQSLPPIKEVGGTTPTVTLQGRLYCKGSVTYTNLKAHQISCGKGNAVNFPIWQQLFKNTFFVKK